MLIRQSTNGPSVPNGLNGAIAVRAVVEIPHTVLNMQKVNMLIRGCNRWIQAVAIIFYI